MNQASIDWAVAVLEGRKKLSYMIVKNWDYDNLLTHGSRSHVPEFSADVVHALPLSEENASRMVADFTTRFPDDVYSYHSNIDLAEMVLKHTKEK